MLQYVYDDNELSIDINMELRKGSICRLHPSSAYMGLWDGLVEIIEFIHVSSYDELDTHMSFWIDSICPDGEYHPDKRYPENIQEYVDCMIAQPWVVAEYQDTGEIVVMPLQEFLDHSSKA